MIHPSPTPGISSVPGYAQVSERTPYAAIVLAQPSPPGQPNGPVVVVGSVWFGSSLVRFDCRYADGTRRQVSVSHVYDPGEVPEIMLFPLRRVAPAAPVIGGAA